VRRSLLCHVRRPQHHPNDLLCASTSDVAPGGCTSGSGFTTAIVNVIAVVATPRGSLTVTCAIPGLGVDRAGWGSAGNPMVDEKSFSECGG
jgi:hypothetical protein